MILVVVGLGALALPLQSLHLAFPSDSTASVDTTQRKASDLVADAFGPGRDAPMLTVVDARDVPEEDRGAAYDEVVAWAAGLDDVTNAQIVGMNEQGTGATVLITPATRSRGHRHRGPAHRPARRPGRHRGGRPGRRPA